MLDFPRSGHIIYMHVHCMYMYMYVYVVLYMYLKNRLCQGEIVLHPTDEGRKLETAVVQGFNYTFFSFNTAHM